MQAPVAGATDGCRLNVEVERWRRAAEAGKPAGLIQRSVIFVILCFSPVPLPITQRNADEFFLEQFWMDYI